MPYEEFLADFLLESRERLDRLEDILLALGETAPERRRSALDEACRELHTLKGNSGMMGFKDLQGLAHSMEDTVHALDAKAPQVGPLLEGLDEFRRLLGLRSAPAPPSREADGAVAPAAEESFQGSVRVAFSALDGLMDHLAEMVIFRNRLADTVQRACSQGAQRQGWEEVQLAQEVLGKTLGLIQEGVMRLRVVPLRSLFGRMKRIAHDEAVKEGKGVRFEATGGETPMDKALLEVASAALGHIVRNAVVHGIEPPEVRLSRGKSKTGRIKLTASLLSNEVSVEVVDDGAGIDRRALEREATERGIDCSRIDDLNSLVFHPGFSTRKNADMSAGRGMGLSSALEAVRRICGHVEVSSEPGMGTLFRLRLPLSVSIVRALLVRADGEEYALPVSAVVESRKLQPGDGHVVNGAGVLPWRDDLVPLLDLGYASRTSRGRRESGYVIIIEADGKHRGLVADGITGLREIVVKKLDPILGSWEGLSGSTILGDGRAVLILDPKGLTSVPPFVAGTA